MGLLGLSTPAPFLGTLLEVPGALEVELCMVRWFWSINNMAVLPCSWQALPMTAVSTMLEWPDSRAAAFKDREFCDSPDFCLGRVRNKLGSQLCTAPYWEPFPSPLCCSKTSSIPHRNGLCGLTDSVCIQNPLELEAVYLEFIPFTLCL